ncbi:cell division cycle protein 27 homolog B isoform X3 [Cryptomeria japonica]|uniref:cell division cycle protein 27 homolog B isoform X3 n=1 Tax=Cryptomeria japonica TaxID=3369 RepID=UPI0027D9EC6D|nr:cell division cycle protein 27 homolog B isoform X3 [Cryptomeria japonica]
MEAKMVECVNSSLRLYMYRNATFLCERLCAEYPSESNFQLLACCFLRSNQAYRAYHILKGTQLPQSRYLFAFSCFEMGLHREAEAALCPVNEPSTEIPNGAAGHYLLGLIYRYTDRRKISIEHFIQAVSLDPFLWSAYEELCILGATEEAAELLGDSAVFRLQQQQMQLELSSQYLASSGDERVFPPSRSSHSGEPSPRQAKQLGAAGVGELPAGHAPGPVPGNVALHNTPFTVNMTAYSTPSPVASQVVPAGPPPLNRNIQYQQNPNTTAADISPRSGVNAPGQPPRRKFMDEGKLRKSIRSSSTRAAYSQVSGRLFSETAPRRSTRLSGDATGQVSSSVLSVGGNGTGNSSSKLGGGFLPTNKINPPSTLRTATARKGHSTIESSFDPGKKYEAFEDSGTEDMIVNTVRRPGSVPVEDEPRINSRLNVNRNPRFAEGSLELLGLLRVLGEAFNHSCMHRCKEALQAFCKLPQQHYATGWVLCQVGKAYFEMVDYSEAERAFSWARRVSPYNLEGMDIYSTVLFHMKEEMKLSYLAQELNAIDRLSPQAWCALGNCYSLQKDHETALKTFQRAIQIDSRFTYAHTLCGHEYVAMEEFENGINCYRSALRIDPRHYNAWYGLGMIYLRQEKYNFAEHHFRTAYLINPRSSVLMCYLGMALHALKRHEDALQMLDQAISADPKNPLPTYQKANVLVSNERYKDALKELELLKEVAPRESSVYSLIGKIYKRLNVPEQAMYYFGLALDLKPSTADVAIIKSAIEKMHVPDDIEDQL